MNDRQAEKQLSELLNTYTTGSVLHLLADLCRTFAEDAKQEGDVVA